MRTNIRAEDGGVETGAVSVARCPTCQSDERDWRKNVFESYGMTQSVGTCSDVWHDAPTAVMSDEEAERMYLEVPVGTKEFTEADCCATMPCKHVLGAFARAVLAARQR